MTKKTGWLIAFAAFLAYLATMADGPSAGSSAGFLATAAGLAPKLNPLNYFSALLLKLILLVPAGTLALRGTVANAVMSCLSVMLVYRIVSSVVRYCIQDVTVSREIRDVAAIAAGAGASIFLAFCIPFYDFKPRASRGV